MTSVGDGVTIDANVMAEFKDELTRGEGSIHDIVERICEDYGIAASELIEQEYFNTCNTYIFKEWYTGNLVLGKIRFVQGKLPKGVSKKLHQTCGFPRGKSRDKAYIQVAYNTKKRYIVSLDYDFYDPSVKKSTKEAKRRAREQRKGKACKWLKKNLGITVGLPTHAASELWTD